MNALEKRASIGARRSPDTEDAVLQAAADLIAEAGYSSLTMEAVAKRARAGKATLYRWWPSRAHLVLALVSRAKLDMGAPNTGTLRGDLSVYMAELIAIWRGDDGAMPLGPLVRVLYSEAQNDSDFAQRLAEERRLRWLRLDEILDAARLRGELAARLTPARAKSLCMALPIYLLMTDQLPGINAFEPMIDDILAGLRA